MMNAMWKDAKKYDYTIDELFVTPLTRPSTNVGDAIRLELILEQFEAQCTDVYSTLNELLGTASGGTIVLHKNLPVSSLRKLMRKQVLLIRLQNTQTTLEREDSTQLSLNDALDSTDMFRVSLGAWIGNRFRIPLAYVQEVFMRADVERFVRLERFVHALLDAQLFELDFGKTATSTQDVGDAFRRALKTTNLFLLEHFRTIAELSAFDQSSEYGELHASFVYDVYAKVSFMYRTTRKGSTARIVYRKNLKFLRDSGSVSFVARHEGMTAFLVAAFLRDMFVSEYFLMEKLVDATTIDQQNDAGNTALHLLMMGTEWTTDKYVVFDLYLNLLIAEYGANFRIENTDGVRPLFLACRYNGKRFIDTLLGLGDNINAPNSRNTSTPIIYALDYGATENTLMYMLREKGADSGYSPSASNESVIVAAARAYQPGIVGYVLSEKNVNTRGRDASESALTLLMEHIASEEEFIDEDKLHGDVEYTVYGEVDKEIEKINEAKGTVGELLDRGASALYVENIDEREWFMDLLYDYEDTVHTMNADNRLSVFNWYARGVTEPPSIRTAEIIDYDERVADIVDLDGWTMLTWAVHTSDIEFVRRLLEHGARLAQPDAKGRVALDVARTKSEEDDESYMKWRAQEILTFLSEYSAPKSVKRKYTTSAFANILEEKHAQFARSFVKNIDNK